ncbi:hypothetical protein [Nocardia terpenica]|uniref:Uncharacterized protein n=1 Tax=Nocardia terpenica TaxID=455432 RepID=A0A164HIR2_9NOCA|nr:hypothetical protein [Nocardia terpenica]KZM68552.1 hypothetical protein AWN90_11875 [Nocardia terpenica]NQE88485.1 hypothetical protein [Nocardia terpenica]
MTAATATATPTAEKLWAALQQAPGSTAKGLAETAGIGGSTARKLLVALERTGTAYRTEGEADGSAQRPADRWWPHTPAADSASAETPATDETEARAGLTGQPTTPAEATESAPEPAEAQAPAEPADEAVATDTAPDTAPSATLEQEEQPEPDTTEPAPDAPADTETAEPTTAPAPAAQGKRLPPGGLRGMVEEFLRDCAGREFGPTAIGKDLGRSVGAVANALEKLVADGIAVKICEAPKRYMIPNA